MSRVIGIVALLSLSLGQLGCEVPPPPPRPKPPAEMTRPEPPVDPMTTTDTLLPEPHEHYAASLIGSEAFPVPPWAKHLKGVKICLDPGHGGDAQKRGFKRGATGVREAEINLRVGLYLRELLQQVGAEVKMTRETDVDSTLKERADVANAWGADIFVSLHHNAVGKPDVNYTTVWYHADVDNRPSNLDLARNLCDALYEHFPQTTFTDVPIKSDQLMYGSGFAVLANARVTAALCESSFFTNPEEEQRLRDPKHNFREAYAMFIGLARYAHGGLPRAKLIDPADGVVLMTAPQTRPAIAAVDVPEHNAPYGAILTFQLDDGLRSRRAWGWERNMIITDSVVAKVDDRVIDHVFTPGDYRMFAFLPGDLEPGEHLIEVQFVNKNKNSILDPFFKITIPAAQSASD